MLALSTDWIGSLAAILTTVSFVPQAWRTWRTRDVSGISLAMYAVFTVGVGLWLVYGLLLGEMPLIAANAITFTLALLILGMRIRYGRDAESEIHPYRSCAALPSSTSRPPACRRPTGIGPQTKTDKAGG